MAPLQGFRCKFPTQRSRELFRRNREFERENGEFHLTKPKSSSDEVFGNTAGTPIGFTGGCESCDNPAPLTRSNGELYLEPNHTRRLANGGPDHPCWVAAIWSVGSQREIARKRAAMDIFVKTEMDKHTLDAHKNYTKSVEVMRKHLQQKKPQPTNPFWQHSLDQRRIIICREGTGDPLRHRPHLQHIVERRDVNVAINGRFSLHSSHWAQYCI